MIDEKHVIVMINQMKEKYKIRGSPLYVKTSKLTASTTKGSPCFQRCPL